MLSNVFPISRTTFLARRRFSLSIFASLRSTMSIDMKFHAFAGSKIRSKIPKSKQLTPASALETLKHSLLQSNPLLDNNDCGKILLFKNGRPLVGYPAEDNSDSSVWRLEWLNAIDCRELVTCSGERPIVYLGVDVDGENDLLWGVDVSSENDDGEFLAKELRKRSLCFVELRTLMVATDWTDVSLMQQLAVAGQGRALLEWSLVSQFCGYCGAKTVPVEAGRKKQCLNDSCKRRIYPRVDTVLI